MIHSKVVVNLMGVVHVTIVVHVTVVVHVKVVFHEKEATTCRLLTPWKKMEERIHSLQGE